MGMWMQIHFEFEFNSIEFALFFSFKGLASGSLLEPYYSTQRCKLQYVFIGCGRNDAEKLIAWRGQSGLICCTRDVHVLQIEF
jgi:hypothetical protein